MYTHVSKCKNDTKKKVKKERRKASQKWAGRVAQGLGPEFKLQYHRKKNSKSCFHNFNLCTQSFSL
jgi:hypothetical protein